MKNKIDNMFVDYRNIQNVECRSRLWLAIVAVMLSLLMASCVKELAETGGSSVTPDGKVLISLSVGVPVSNPMQTRATEGEENQINSLAIIVLDADNKLSQSPAFATFDGTKWKVALAPTLYFRLFMRLQIYLFRKRKTLKMWLLVLLTMSFEDY